MHFSTSGRDSLRVRLESGHRLFYMYDRLKRPRCGPLTTVHHEGVGSVPWGTFGAPDFYVISKVGATVGVFEPIIPILRRLQKEGNGIRVWNTLAKVQELLITNERDFPDRADVAAMKKKWAGTMQDGLVWNQLWCSTLGRKHTCKQQHTPR